MCWALLYVVSEQQPQAPHPWVPWDLLPCVGEWWPFRAPVLLPRSRVPALPSPRSSGPGPGIPSLLLVTCSLTLSEGGLWAELGSESEAVGWADPAELCHRRSPRGCLPSGGWSGVLL